jgi:serine protease Do
MGVGMPLRGKWFKPKKMMLPLAIAAVALVSGCASGSTGLTLTKTVTATAQVTTPVMTLADFADVIAAVRPSVVAITTEVSGYSIFGAYTEEGAGSGWIIDSKGLVVTNNHVVDGASSVTVTLEDGRTFAAKAVYSDAFSDLAVIRIDAQNLPAAKLGDSSSLRMGDWVVAIGNSLGMGISATKGIVSATGVSVTESAGNTLYNLIQTDAAINAGNSGGPLVNLAGEVIGVNSVKISDVGVEGMGYAISIVEAEPILQQLIASGHISRPDIGANFYTVDQTIAGRYNLAVSQGALITQVTANGPADEAGLKAGDVITAIDGTAVTTADGLQLLLQSYKVGQQVQVTYYRGSNKQTVSVTLAEAS